MCFLCEPKCDGIASYGKDGHIFGNHSTDINKHITLNLKASTLTRPE